MAAIRKILFVCMDNTCRSVMAEAVMKSVWRGPKLSIASRGLVVLFPEPLNPNAVAVLTGNQMAPEKTATEALSAADLEEGTLVLAMTSREAAKVREDYPGASLVYTLGDFAGKPGDIEEPHGGTLAEYGACCEYIDLLVKLVVERLLRIREKQKAAAGTT